MPSRGLGSCSWPASPTARRRSTTAPTSTELRERSDMTDYGHPITFGLSLYPSVDLVDDNTRLAQEADEAGLEYIAIQDHAYNREFLDTWTLISYLAAETERITFVPDVLDLQLRPPTIVAKAAASLSVL